MDRIKTPQAGANAGRTAALETVGDGGTLVAFGGFASLYAAALAYASHGLPIFPVAYPISRDGKWSCSCRSGDECDAPAKHPRISGWRQNATTDDAWVNYWWMPNNRFARSNIGLVTGADSSLVVLDLDPRNGGDATLAQRKRSAALATARRSSGWVVYDTHDLDTWLDARRFRSTSEADAGR